MIDKVPRFETLGIVITDIAEFGRRTTQLQLAARHIMKSAVCDALAEIGYDWHPGPGDELGDGLRVLLPESVALAHPLPVLLDAALRRHNARRPADEQVRLRVAVGMAEVEFDGPYAASPSVLEAFRLVEARQLKRALRSVPGPLALIASQHFYNEVIQRVAEARPETYRPVRVRTKEGRVTGWIMLPGQPAEATERARWARIAAALGILSTALVSTLRFPLAGGVLRSRRR